MLTGPPVLLPSPARLGCDSLWAQVMEKPCAWLGSAAGASPGLQAL